MNFLCDHITGLFALFKDDSGILRQRVNDFCNYKIQCDLLNFINDSSLISKKSPVETNTFKPYFGDILTTLPTPLFLTTLHTEYHLFNSNNR